MNSNEKLSQAEIDLFLEAYNNASGKPVEANLNDIEAAKLRNKQHGKVYKQLLSALKRYEYALESRAPYNEIQEQRRNVHFYAFKNWLMHKRLDKEQFYDLIRKEIKKRELSQLKKPGQL